MRSRRSTVLAVLCASFLLVGCSSGGEAQSGDGSGEPAASQTEQPSATPTPEEPAELIGGGTTMFPDRRTSHCTGTREHPGSVRWASRDPRPP